MQQNSPYKTDEECINCDLKFALDLDFDLGFSLKENCQSQFL